VWTPSLEHEPRPADPAEIFRWEHTRLRARILEERHEDDLIIRQIRQYGGTRAKLIGRPDLSVNFLAALCRQLSVLYMDRGTIRHPLGTFPELLGEDVPDAADPAETVRLPGYIENAGYWAIMNRVQLWTLGLNEMLMHPVVADLDTDNPRVVYREVPPHHVTAIPDYDDPSRPMALRWCTKRTDPKTGKTGWCWDEWDIQDRENPSYRVIAIERDGRDGDDVTPLFFPGPMSGDAYQWRRGDGRPVLPWVIYHSAWPSGLWDPWHRRAAVEGSMELSLDWAFWRHCFQDASFPQTWAIGCRVRPDEVVPGKGTEPATAHYINDPTRVLEFIADDNASNPQVGRFTVGVDVKALGEALAAKEARLGQQMGVDASDLVRTSGDPRSGYALAISQEAKRQAQVTYRPQFERADKELIALTAIVLNRAIGTSFPEADYQIDYAEVGAPGAGSENADGDGAAPAIQDTVWNGAQMAEARGTVADVASGVIPRESGVALLLAAGIADDEAEAEAIMSTAGAGFTPTPKSPPTAPQPAPNLVPPREDPEPDPEPAPPPAK
jgi:hypothetical protein